jgi:hypothetical protein
VEVNNKLVTSLKDRPLPPGGSLKYSGGSEAAICDATWKELARVPADASATRVTTGQLRVKVGCAVQGGANLKIEVRMLGPAKRIATSASPLR